MTPRQYIGWVGKVTRDDQIECIAVAMRDGTIIRWDSVDEFIADVEAHQRGEFVQEKEDLSSTDAETVRMFGEFTRRALHAISHWRLA